MDLAGARLGADEWAKYHALGNDYLIMDGAGRAAPAPAFVRALCARHEGVGSDGLLWRTEVQPGVAAQAALRIFNPDGSEAEKSGNGLRIFARFLFDFGYVSHSRFGVALGQEVIDCVLLNPAGGAPALPCQPGAVLARVANVRCSMGRALFSGAAVGLAAAEADTRRWPLQVGRELLDATLVGFGNPHCVVFGTAHDAATLRRIGPAIANDAQFARRINVQLANVVDRRRVRALIWERGVGETSASGSSSCAVAAAAYARGLVEAQVTVQMPGGEVTVALAADGQAELTGPAAAIARGRLLC